MARTMHGRSSSTVAHCTSISGRATFIVSFSDTHRLRYSPRLIVPSGPCKTFSAVAPPVFPHKDQCATKRTSFGRPSAAVFNAEGLTSTKVIVPIQIGFIFCAHDLRESVFFISRRTDCDEITMAKNRSFALPGLAMLSRDEFERRWKTTIYDPAFEKAPSETDRSLACWEAYNDHRKSPRTPKCWTGMLPTGTLSSHRMAGNARQIRAAEKKIKKKHDGDSPDPLVCASPRTDETCPSEMSKTFRIGNAVRIHRASTRIRVDFLDLSRSLRLRRKNFCHAKPVFDRHAALSLACLCYPNIPGAGP